MNTVGVVCALSAERRTLRRVDANDSVSATTSGVGSERAVAAARELANAGARNLVSWGFAGGLDPQLVSGQLVFPTTIVCEDATLAIGDEFADRLEQRLAPLAPVRAALANTSQVIDSVPAKAVLQQRTSAAAVDMESAALGRFAREHGLGFAAVRAIVDDAATALPATALAAVDERGGTAWLALGRSLARRPRELIALTRLAGSARKAERTLRDAAALCFGVSA